jgi:hypothetical protein
MEASPPAEKYPAQGHQANCLPKSDFVQPKETGHQPVPQVQDRLAESGDGYGHEKCNLQHHYSPTWSHFLILVLP